MYLENERLSLVHSTAVSFLVAMAMSSFLKRILKYPHVSSMAEMKEAGRWSFKHSWRALKVALPLRVLPITVLRTFLVAFSCISNTMSVGKSASNSKL